MEMHGTQMLHPSPFLFLRWSNRQTAPIHPLLLRGLRSTRPMRAAGVDKPRLGAFVRLHRHLLDHPGSGRGGDPALLGAHVLVEDGQGDGEGGAGVGDVNDAADAALAGAAGEEEVDLGWVGGVFEGWVVGGGGWKLRAGLSRWVCCKSDGCACESGAGWGE